MLRNENIQRCPGPASVRGFSLLEVLVALVVIAVGMLGVAVLYVEGMKAERTSLYRTSAVNLVAELADRIRANPTATLSYTDAPADGGCTNGVVDCSPEQIAHEDLWWWNLDIEERLPAGAVGAVNIAPGDGTDRYTISVSWSEAGFATPQSYAVTFDR
jgi:type IV pilus assembly protein PilV